MASRDEEAEPSHLLRSNALHQYIMATSVLPREADSLRELREITAQHPMKIMGTTAEGGQFLGLLLKLIGARKTIEVGVFTGYSLLATALAIPNDGEIVALDISREDFEIGLPVIQKAGVAHKIDFRGGPALPALDRLMEDEKKRGSFDFAFVDADKNNYLRYHERLMELVKVGGVIAYDNTLLFGAVAAPPGAALNEYTRYMRPFVVELNEALAADPRVEICQLPIGDGVTLCRRIS